MVEEGNIIYFTPFFFPNGKSQAKPKYCIVLKEIGNKTLIASLPTSKDSIPSGIQKKGCVEMPEINLNAFIFPKGIEVTTSGKSFRVDTFVYGHQLDFYSVEFLHDLYRLENIDYEIFGKMKPDLFNELLACLKSSKAVKKKFLKHIF